MLLNLKENLNGIQSIIAREQQAHALTNEPLIIAVSKKQPVEKIKALNELGIVDFGENYLQEALPKIEELADLRLRWHYIGNIQSKKIKDLVGNFELIHTVSRVSEVERISRVAVEKDLIQNYLVQVNIAGEASKQGVAADEANEIIEELKTFQNVQLSGMMVFPPLSESDEESLQWFERGRLLFEKLQKSAGSSFKYLSMGTSQDFHLALRQGATHLRIGERLLGPRS